MGGKTRAYRWCDFSIACSTALPELRETETVHAASWTVSFVSGRAPARPGRRWFHHWRLPDGQRWAQFAREGRGHVVRFCAVGDFDIDIDRRIIRGYAGADTPEHTMRHLLLDQVLPLLVGDHSHLAVHASVVNSEQGAVVLLGASGHGKSSLAARLGQRGHTVLSDDCCVLRRTGGSFEVVPSYPGVRLRPDAISGAWAATHGRPVAHYSTKIRVDGEFGVGFNEHPSPLASIYVIAPRRQLEASSRIAIDPLSPRQGMLDLVDYTFHLDIHDDARMRHAFELAGDVAGSHRLRSLVFPWDLSQVDRVADAILADIA
jgi:hypothetical protein